MNDNKDSIYRLRPACEYSFDELKNHYLWFSRPSEFKDINDANIVSFVLNNESIKDSFERIFKDYNNVAKLASYTGICCFTETLPTTSKWKNFPGAKDGIAIEYDRNIIEQFFINEFNIGDCFKKIEYLKEPVIFDSYSKYDIVWETTKDGTFYESLRAIEKDPKKMDKLFLMMFTRLNQNYKKQNESRIILGGANIPDKREGIRGYKITIPKEAIKKVHFHPKTPENIINDLKDFIGE